MGSKLIDRWKGWMLRRGSFKNITRGGQNYLDRYYLLALGGGRLRPRFLLKRVKLKVFLHTFWADDPDPPHDHPWAWGRIILRGRYREHYHDGTFVECGPGHVVWRRSARELHRVELLTDRVTTLFWHWGRKRTWGFLTSQGWHPTPDGSQDGRPLVGTFFPRKIGREPKEVVL